MEQVFRGRSNVRKLEHDVRLLVVAQEVRQTMLILLQLLTVLTVSIAMALSLAHALEYPGKMRLKREDYLAAQKIYYPGFTFGGGSEPLGAIFLILCLVFVPLSKASFWLIAVALLANLAVQGIYWTVTHPINKAWLRYEEMGRAGRTFFALDENKSADSADKAPADEWIDLRDRWEMSHIARAVFAMASFLLLILALLLRI